MQRLRRATAAAPLVVAAALAAVAVAAARGAGCDDPGRYVPVAGGYELVGGCLAPGDLLVPGPGGPAPDAPLKG
jgi:hypothetical protein